MQYLRDELGYTFFDDDENPAEAIDLPVLGFIPPLRDYDDLLVGLVVERSVESALIRLFGTVEPSEGYQNRKEGSRSRVPAEAVDCEWTFDESLILIYQRGVPTPKVSQTAALLGRWYKRHLEGYPSNAGRHVDSTEHSGEEVRSAYVATVEKIRDGHHGRLSFPNIATHLYVDHSIEYSRQTLEYWVRTGKLPKLF